MAKDLLKMDWVDQTDKTSLGQEKETKGDFTVQSANVERRHRLRKCVQRRSLEIVCFSHNSKSGKKSLVRQTGSAYMHCTTYFSISVILLINAVLLIQGTKTAAGGVPGIWDQGMADLPQL